MEEWSIEGKELLKFQQFSSFVDYTFWHQLSKNKLDVYRLSEEQVSLVGSFSSRGASGIPSQVRVTGESFDGSHHPSLGWCRAQGTLLNTNTIETYVGLDRKALMKQVGAQMQADVAEGRPNNLCRFVLITFADLKKYKFLYWFAFPALGGYKALACGALRPLKSVMTSEKKQAALVEKFVPFLSSSCWWAIVKESNNDDEVELINPAEVSQEMEEVTLAVADASTMDEHPGWNVRNVLQYVAVKFHTKRVNLFLLRDFTHSRNLEKSRHVRVVLEKDKEDDAFVAGWEKDAKGNSKPRSVDLSLQMDPKKLLTTAVDLNLKLMKWRLAPEMNLEQISQMKCLLLGAGTLGCNVARALLGWGCRNITFVDSGKVSFSNPVRQSLFAFDDCLEGGKPKAVAAAESVKRIFPECNAEGVQMSIPMPGHPIPPGEVEKAKKDHDKLRGLAESHDVIFLLTDSREARWLGTVLGAALGKIVINAALGFDSYLVMRHGNRTRKDCELGCYFCSDVVAPTDSLRDRTLDQQCTVTRPGVSMLASALAVELLVAMLHSPTKDSAPADTPSNGATPNASNTVGLVPHQIRGFIGTYSHMLIVGHAYDRCTACSAPVLKGYLENPFDFVLKVCASSTFLEELTGLADMKRETVAWEVSEDGTDGDDFSME